MNITIRSFENSDIPFIESLVPRFSGFDLPVWRTKEEIDNANMKSLKQAMEISHSNSAIFIAEDEGKVQAGFMHLQIQNDFFNNEKIAYLSDIAVATAFEGRGIGRILLTYAEKWAHAQGCQAISLYVFAKNTHARNIYEISGYAEEVIKYIKPLNHKLKVENS